MRPARGANWSSHILKIYKSIKLTGHHFDPRVAACSPYWSLMLHIPRSPCPSNYSESLPSQTGSSSLCCWCNHAVAPQTPRAVLTPLVFSIPSAADEGCWLPISRKWSSSLEAFLWITLLITDTSLSLKRALLGNLGLLCSEASFIVIALVQRYASGLRLTPWLRFCWFCRSEAPPSSTFCSI